MNNIYLKSAVSACSAVCCLLYVCCTDPPPIPPQGTVPLPLYIPHHGPQTRQQRPATLSPDGDTLAGRVRATLLSPYDTLVRLQVLPHAQLLCVNIKKRAQGEFYVFRFILMSLFDLINQLMKALGGIIMLNEM